MKWTQTCRHVEQRSADIQHPWEHFRGDKGLDQGPTVALTMRVCVCVWWRCTCLLPGHHSKSLFPSRSSPVQGSNRNHNLASPTVRPPRPQWKGESFSEKGHYICAKLRQSCISFSHLPNMTSSYPWWWYKACSSPTLIIVPVPFLYLRQQTLSIFFLKYIE